MVMLQTDGEPEPRLPLLGLRALLANKLQLRVDTHAGLFVISSLRTDFSFDM
jgi:hypothetical protein